MRLHIVLALSLALLSTIAHCKPLDDDNSGSQENSDKKDAIDDTKLVDEANNAESAKPDGDAASLADSPITDPSSSSNSDSSNSDAAGGDKRGLDSDTASKREETSTTTTTAAPSTTETTTTTEAPDGPDEPTVEGSDNNTRTMKGTTFHVAFHDKSVQYDESMKDSHNIHFKDYRTLIAKEAYDNYPDFKQSVVITIKDADKAKEEKEKEKENKDKEATTRDNTGNGVVVDMYLRFYNAGKHLVKLTDVLKSGKLGTHEVGPLFVRAYVAEPTGLVCTPDCKVQCYSYCDAGCCHVNIVQNIEMPTPSPVEEFMQNREMQLKTGLTTPEPCKENECKQPEQQQQAMIMPMPMQMPQPQMPCQGAACGAPMMPQMPCAQPPCQAPMMMPMMQPQMGCAQPPCAPPPMPMQMPCAQPPCAPPPMPMPCAQPPCAPPPPPPMPMPCARPPCPAPPMPMPCAQPPCAPPPMMMAPPPMPMQMPCAQPPCQAPMMMPMMQPQMGCAQPPCAPPPMPMPQMCPPSCSQICAPSCPNQCCGGAGGAAPQQPAAFGGWPRQGRR